MKNHFKIYYSVFPSLEVEARRDLPRGTLWAHVVLVYREVVNQDFLTAVITVAFDLTAFALAPPRTLVYVM